MKLSLMSIAVMSLALAACGQETKAPADAAPDAKPGLSAANGVLILPAVKGNPGAAFFDLTNAGSRPATLATSYIEGSDKSEFHETLEGRMGPMAALEIAPGQTVKFARGGKHVMAFGLSDNLKPGEKTEMTLTFADGDKLSTQLDITAAGAASSGHDMTGEHAH